MGDVLHAMPAVAWLRDQLPGAFIGWAIEPRWASLLQTEGALPSTPGMPLVDRVHPVPTRDWSRQPLSLATLGSIRSLRRQLRSEHYTVAIDLQGSIRSAVLCRLSGAPVIVGPAAPREAPARWLYTNPVLTNAAHVIDQAAEIVHAARPLAPLSRRPLPPAPLPIDAAAQVWAATLLGEQEAPFVILAPTAGWGAKQWPAQRFGELAAALAQRGYRVLINSIGTDPTASAVQNTARQVLPESMQSSVQMVSATVPELTALLRRTALLIAGDTGPLHLAAALGTPGRCTLRTHRPGTQRPLLSALRHASRPCKRHRPSPARRNRARPAEHHGRCRPSRRGIAPWPVTPRSWCVSQIEKRSSQP